MKKIYLLTMGILLSWNSTHSQTLQIIDAIGGVLLPRVVDGIKEVQNSGNSSKIKYDKEDFNKKVDAVQDYVVGIANAMSNDAQSLSVLSGITARTSQFYDDLGALESLSKNTLIDAIINCNNEPVQRQYALVFDSDLAQLKSDIDGVRTSILNSSLDQSLKDDLTVIIENVRSEYTDFESVLSQSGVQRPSSASSIDNIKNYLQSIKGSQGHISDIKRAVQRSFSLLNSRLSTYNTNALRVKTEVATKFAELDK
jgi:hypothetical protein